MDTNGHGYQADGKGERLTSAKTWLPTEDTELVFRVFRVFRGPNARRTMHASKHLIQSALSVSL